MIFVNCPFCHAEINNYAHIRVPISVAKKDEGEVDVAYALAMIECHACDMVFFLKHNSEKLKSMNPFDAQKMSQNIRAGNRYLSQMTPQEKQDLYEKMKKDFIKKYS